MFEDNHNINDFDLMIKSILDEGQEEVPAHIWKGVSEGLDKAARRKTIVLWWRRAAVSVVAAAAVAIAVVFNSREDIGIQIEESNNGIIAVAEPAVVNKEEIITLMPEIIPQSAFEALEYIADASVHTEERIDQQNIPLQETEDQVVRTENKAKSDSTPKEFFPENWDEDKPQKKNLSFVLSGLASTNSTQNHSRIGPMKAPVTSVPKKTGITETSTNSIYGLPVSFGVGVKVGIGDRWSLGSGINYSILNRQFYGKYNKIDDTGTINTISSDIRNTQHYIGIPINAYYDIVHTDRISFYTYAGGTVEKCIGDNYNVLKTAIRHNEKVKGVQFSANAGIGVEFLIGNHLGLYLDPSIRYYFDCNQPKSIRTVQPLMLGFELGLRANL